MDSVYDIPCLILYIKCSISYKYFKLCSNIWMRVEILLCICVQMFLIFRKWRSGTKSGEHHIKGVMKTSNSMRSVGQFWVLSRVYEKSYSRRPDLLHYFWTIILLLNQCFKVMVDILPFSSNNVFSQFLCYVCNKFQSSIYKEGKGKVRVSWKDSKVVFLFSTNYSIM